MLIKFLESSKCFDSAYASRKAVLSNNYRAHNSHDLWEIWFSLELEKPEKFGNNVAVSWQMWMKCFSFADTIRSFMNNFLISNLLFSVFFVGETCMRKAFCGWECRARVERFLSLEEELKFKPPTLLRLVLSFLAPESLCNDFIRFCFSMD